jgi:hypothetical protein
MEEEEGVEVDDVVEVVAAIGFEEEENFLASRKAFTLFAYSQVRGR